MCIKREKKQHMKDKEWKDTSSFNIEQHMMYVNGYKTKRYTTQKIYQYQCVSN